MNKFKILVLGLTLIWGVNIIAQETIETPQSEISVQQPEKKLEEMSLEELLNMEVTTVTKKAQRISEAPGIISVITAEDIENMGAQNLYEVLSMLPGVEIRKVSMAIVR